MINVSLETRIIVLDLNINGSESDVGLAMCRYRDALTKNLPSSASNGPAGVDSIQRWICRHRARDSLYYRKPMTWHSILNSGFDA